MSNKHYNILICVSELFFLQALVTMLSAIKNLKKEINFYLMQNDWSDQTKIKCLDFFKQFPPHTINFLDVNEEDLHSFKPFKGVYIIYYKLIAHKYLPDTVDRILYLDSDVIIRKDIEEFYFLDFDDNYLISTNNRMETHPKQTYDEWVIASNSNKHKFEYTYSNPGVLIINVAKFRKEKIDIEFYKNQIKQMGDEKYFADEGIINFCFWDKRKLVPSYKWQAMVQFVDVWKNIFDMSKEERIANYNEAYHEDFDEEHSFSIIHFVPVIKPWNCIFDSQSNTVYEAKNVRVKPTWKMMFYVEWWNLAKSLPRQYYENLLVNGYVTPERNLNKLVTNVKNFYEKVSYDFLNNATLFSYLQSCNGKKVSLLKAQDSVAVFLATALEQNNADVTFKTTKGTLTELTDEEWNKCKIADIIICCCIHGCLPLERDGIKPIMASNLLADNTLPISTKHNLFTYSHLTETVFDQVKLLDKDIKKQTEIIESEIKDLHVDKNKLNIELGKLNVENKHLTERLNIANKQVETLSQERNEFYHSVSKLETAVNYFKNDLDFYKKQNIQLITSLSEASLNREASKTQIKSLEMEKEVLINKIKENDNTIANLRDKIEENDDTIIRLRSEIKENDNTITELQNKIEELENSHSWRITKPLRSIMWFFRRLFGKTEK